MLTVDTVLSPPAGTGGLRFVNVSPTALGGLDVYANGTKAFSSLVYKQVSKNYLYLPAGNYALQADTANGDLTCRFTMPSDTRLLTNLGKIACIRSAGGTP